MNFQELELQSERLILKRVCVELHAEEIHHMMVDSMDSLIPWIPWAKQSLSVKVLLLILFCYTLYVYIVKSRINIPNTVKPG